MTHPITPPPELVEQWAAQAGDMSFDQLAQMIYAAGADQELEACCEWLERQTLCGHRDLLPQLRAARRPKPPSLKQQALHVLDTLSKAPNIKARLLGPVGEEIIRRALEALSDD